MRRNERFRIDYDKFEANIYESTTPLLFIHHSKHQLAQVENATCTWTPAVLSLALLYLDALTVRFDRILLLIS